MYKKLPHIDALNHYQFVTFRTHDSLNPYMKKIINNTNLQQNVKEYQIDKYLDNSLDGAYLKGGILDYLFDFFQALDKKVYNLVCFVIMPNHVHLLFEQIKPMDETMRVVKSKSAIDINKLLQRSGKFWATEYYDKVIRDDEHFSKVYRYIENNALKAELGNDGRFYSVYL